MKNKNLLLKKVIATFSAVTLIHSPIAMAADEGGTGAGDGTEQTNQQPITFEGGSSAEQSAGSSSAQGALTAGMGAAGGVMQIAMGTTMLKGSPTPAEKVMGYALIAMGGMQLAQAALTMGNSNKAGNSRGLAANLGTFGDDTGTGAGFGNQKNAIDGQIASGLDALKKAGATVDPKTGVVTTPGGKISPSAFNSAASLAAATGMSLSDAEKVLEQGKSIAANAASRYKVSGVGLDTSGGGGGGGSAMKFNYDSQMPDFSKLFGGDRKPAAVAGMTKLVDGVPVGVAGDDIFKMVNRRYQTLNSNGRFLDK